nr:hypothetical protein [Angustibacter aerolatus]
MAAPQPAVRREAATPDTSVGDLIGDVDPVRVAQGRTLGDPDTIHYGLVPRTHRGIFAINEPARPPRAHPGVAAQRARGARRAGARLPDPAAARPAARRQREPRGLHQPRPDHHAAEGPLRRGGAHALPARARRRDRAGGAGGRAWSPTCPTTCSRSSRGSPARCASRRRSTPGRASRRGSPSRPPRPWRGRPCAGPRCAVSPPWPGSATPSRWSARCAARSSSRAARRGARSRCWRTCCAPPSPRRSARGSAGSTSAASSPRCRRAPASRPASSSRPRRCCSRSARSPGWRRCSTGSARARRRHPARPQPASSLVLEGLHLTRRLAKDVTDDGRTVYGG